VKRNWKFCGVTLPLGPTRLTLAAVNVLSSMTWKTARRWSELAADDRAIGHVAGHDKWRMESLTSCRSIHWTAPCCRRVGGPDLDVTLLEPAWAIVGSLPRDRTGRKRRCGRPVLDQQLHVADLDIVRDIGDDGNGGASAPGRQPAY